MPFVDKIKRNCKEIILFGSAARGEQTADSDIDLFILTHDPECVKKEFAECKQKMLFSPIIKTPNQWSELEIKEPEFYNEVKRGTKLL